MDSLLKILLQNANTPHDELAKMLGITTEEVAAKVKQLEDEGVLVGYTCIVNEEKLSHDFVRAVIEVKLTPEREGGFDRLAHRIAKHNEVKSCYLMSGGYDLMVIVEGEDLRQVASFVSEKLATLNGVVSTGTHFMLKTYKSQGVLVQEDEQDERLPITP